MENFTSTEDIKTQIKCKAFKQFDRDAIAREVENFLNNLKQEELISAKVDFETISDKSGYIHFAYILYTIKKLTENN